MKKAKLMILDGTLGKMEESSLVVFLVHKSDFQKEMENNSWQLERAQQVFFNEYTSFKELRINLGDSDDADSCEQSIHKSDFEIEDAVSVIVRREKNGKKYLIAESVRRIVLE